MLQNKSNKILILLGSIVLAFPLISISNVANTHLTIKNQNSTDTYQIKTDLKPQHSTVKPLKGQRFYVSCNHSWNGKGHFTISKANIQICQASYSLICSCNKFRCWTEVVFVDSPTGSCKIDAKNKSKLNVGTS